MAKDDMQVLFCKILIYLYKVLKGNQKKDIYYIQPRTYDFPISREYLQTILIELYEKGYIRNLIYQKATVMTLYILIVTTSKSHMMV